MVGSQSWLWCMLCNFLLRIILCDSCKDHCAYHVLHSVGWFIFWWGIFFCSFCLRKHLQKTLRKPKDVLAKSRYVMLIFLSLKFRQWTFSWNCFELRIPFEQSCCHVKDGCKMRSTFLFWCCHNLFYHNRKYFNATSMKNIFCKIA